MTQDYHQLEVWNRTMDYAVSVYKFAIGLPAEEKYNLASQLRRAATPPSVLGRARSPEFDR